VVLKRVFLAFLFVLLLLNPAAAQVGFNPSWSASPNGTRNVTLPIVNMGGGPNMLERSLFSNNTPSLSYGSWYTPGNGSPAVSTADYYRINGLYWARPYDLDTMGAEGAAIKAREGMRYVWMLGPDHPLGNNYQASGDFYVGYSNDPQVWPDPSTVRVLRRQQDTINVVDQYGYTQNNFLAYENPFLVYNPDSAGDKFYIYAEGYSVSSSRQHELTLFTTADFLTTTLIGPTIPTGPPTPPYDPFDGWTSFGRVQRLGVNNWVAYALGKADASPVNVVFYRYTSTDGWVWTPDYSKILAGSGPFITVSGQEYLITKEAGVSNDYLSLLAVDADKVSLGTYTRISTGFGPSANASVSVYPGPTYLQDMDAYVEDGIASIYVTRGFFNGVNNQLNDGPYLENSPTFYNVVGCVTSNVLNVTSIPPGVPALAVGFRLTFLPNAPRITAFGTGTGGLGTYTVSSTPDVSCGTSITITTNGSLWQQFVDQYFYITDPTAAASAAPLGVRASCAAGVATIQWNNSLPHQNYRVYYGTTSGTQSTLVGDVTGVSTTYSPTLNQMSWFKVVTLNGGEQKFRVVNTYCSSNTAMVNKHVTRVYNDGGDISRINMGFLATADATLTSTDTWKTLELWTDVRFGYKDSGGFITKIYDLGTTKLPRGGDYTPTTSKTWPSTTSGTTYSSSSFRGTTPSWVNSSSSIGYYGNGRGNNIQRKSSMTLMAAYQKTSSSGVATLFGYGSFGGMYLQQASGTSGNVTFAMSSNWTGNPGFTTATAPFSSATTAHVAAATFDASSGGTMTVYLDGVAGSSVASGLGTQMPNSTALLRGQYGAFASTGPVLCSGSAACSLNYATRAYSANNEAAITGAGLIHWEESLSSTKVQTFTNLYN
jgi:hypothetical protein